MEEYQPALETGMLNAVKNTNHSQDKPFIHVPKIDKATGQPIPQWKQEVLKTKISKRMEQERTAQTMQSDNNNGLPAWKKEILAKREEKIMNSEDPILVRKRKIKLLKQEEALVQTPPWKKELLRKKIDQVKEEIVELERQQQEIK